VSIEGIYATPRQRDHALHLGMWLFLGSETLLFAGLFAVYTGYRTIYSEQFEAAFHHNNAYIGTANTIVLITSSFLVAWSIHALRAGGRRIATLCLSGAILLGLTFLALKAFEYTDHLSEGFAPGFFYSSHELPHNGARTFFTIYYAMTGLHALHVIAGMSILGWLVWRVRRGRTTPEHHLELELGGLYWHLVDIVWIFLWPLLYLAG
jgi:cytochrome c oxidase subunit 3